MRWGLGVKLCGAVPWLEDTDIPSDWDQANRFRMRATKATPFLSPVRSLFVPSNIL